MLEKDTCCCYLLSGVTFDPGSAIKGRNRAGIVRRFGRAFKRARAAQGEFNTDGGLERSRSASSRNAPENATFQQLAVESSQSNLHRGLRTLSVLQPLGGVGWFCNFQMRPLPLRSHQRQFGVEPLRRDGDVGNVFVKRAHLQRQLCL